ncbi:helix-turn-helix domain-containing protein [Lactococcus hircilactis]|uniref:Helix-turn-helix domain-containing protein n=1 Tax=Lactococcus hircilactis TaxID=1494462 RepID=A0A7X2D2A7_9LACT|nr:helix-turn-helix transcriptional regulator [Lactococcus hircilactis]MQW40282.1 helix-turn-helix domain-containing protein [Lactococcus hircilactis]
MAEEIMTLKKYRLLNDLTQEEAAEKIGVSKGALSKWERGVTYPTTPNIDKLCELYRTNYMLINFYPNIPFKGMGVS